MKSLNHYINEYKKQLAKGNILYAYRGLIRYMMQLRTYFQKKYPEHFVSGSIYQGYMDMSFFAFTPEVLKQKKLKVIIILDHEHISFEAWLCGVNKTMQKKYWNFFKENGWNKSLIPAQIKGIDSILEKTLVKTPNFDDLDTLTNQIEKGALEFIEDVSNFLSEKPQ